MKTSLKALCPLAVMVMLGAAPLQAAVDASAGAGDNPADTNSAPALTLVAEMEAIPELAWARGQMREVPTELKPALDAWQKLSRLMETNITPETVRSLSRWARPQMTNYTAVSPLAKVKFSVAGEDEAGGRALLEGTVDTLPTHSQVVTRWLKVFLVCDTRQRSIIRTIVTIRGEMRE